MADNQITPFQLTDQFTMDNFNQRINETNTALQNKADLGADGKVPESQLPSMEVDAYTKAQSLSDTTKTLFGLDATAVPDDAMALIKTLIDNANADVNTRASITAGSYTGTGTYGGNNPNHLTFNEEPFLVFLYAYNWSDNWGQIQRTDVNSRIMMIPQFLPVGLPNKNNVLGFSQDGGSGRGWKSGDGKTIYWYSSTNADHQYNYSGYVYYYMAIYK